MSTRLMTLILLPALAAHVLATPNPLSAASPHKRNGGGGDSPSSAYCNSFFHDITAATDANIDLVSIIGGPPENQQVLVERRIQQYVAGSTINDQILAADHVHVEGTYSLYFEYCWPKEGDIKGLFQTHHGLVSNAGYWNLKIDGSSDYSFVESAAAAGWATLSYDRLGVRNSAKPDGTNVVQSPFEIAQSVAIAELLGYGGLGDAGQHSKIVGIGHSYGSATLAGVASVAPNTFDAIVLTGYTANATTGPLGIFSTNPTIANIAYPERFGSDPNDYVISPDVSSDQTLFFHYPNYTQSALDLFAETKSEWTLGQQNTVALHYFYDRSQYVNPVLVVTGEYDAPFCASNCNIQAGDIEGSNQLDTVKALFPSIERFETYLLPDTGHGNNFHPAAHESYQRIIDFASSL
ncbi:hypothetical protein I317_02777 [Kwoniella heveanensis CBS 569]|uniref:AB hydrolase-1 domain-containing protein n=1 Tax=Kwoniella heveanensis BCC8398 TaxID=1296120 RepID=A0A1B9GKM4_9TREE|nr:hypothetical protein I316_06667 [Kwoniella heveanensis BCC8398]OCF43339.1 hypothetical protein I317_02777 [Kwoniella heveanensis CBS 569]